MGIDSKDAPNFEQRAFRLTAGDSIDYFSSDYSTARTRFRAAASAADAVLHTLELDARGPGGKALSIDIAWLGAQRPARVFLHTCGIHGVEAFTGSAVQLALLQRPPVIGATDAWVLVHVLNPYGMAWLRRANENNVDLNRNFLLGAEVWSGAPQLYAALDPLLNPASAPSWDGFVLRAAVLATRYGFHRVKQAIAEGQYEFPRGLFYGGAELQEGPRRFIEWLKQHLRTASYISAVDLHTGLGRYATDTVIPDHQNNITPAHDLSQRLGRHFVAPDERSVAYEVRGGLGAALPKVLPDVQIDFVVQEIGTQGPLTVLHALREENRWHFFGDGSIVHPAKRRLHEALCPSAPRWRRRAIELGIDLAERASGGAWNATRAAPSTGDDAKTAHIAESGFLG